MMRIAKIQTRSWTWTVGSWHREQDERDERDAGHAVGLEAVGGGADRVARVVARAVGDDAGVARVVFLDLEDDLHQVGADVGDLREDKMARTSRNSRVFKELKEGISYAAHFPPIKFTCF